MPSLRSTPDAAEQPRFCSRCAEPLTVVDALYCKRCGWAVMRAIPREPDTTRKPLIAAMLTLVPGLGHLYTGRVLIALVWFFAVGIAYLAQPLGAMLHLVCVANAAFGAGARNPRALHS